MTAVAFDRLPLHPLASLLTLPVQGVAGLALRSAAHPEHAWERGELARRADERAAALAAQGLGPGQVVAVPESPGEDLVLMQHALPRAGAGLLPVGTGLSAAALRALVETAGVEWTWTVDGKGGGRLAPTGLDSAAPAGGEARAPGGGPAAAADAGRHCALIVQTSGSTGGPRAVMLGDRALAASAALVDARLDLRPGDTWLCCLPLRHIGGLSIAYRTALAGACLLLREGFDAARVWDDLERHAVTQVSLVPPMLARLLELGPGPGRPAPPALRAVLVGGQRLSAPLARRAIDAGWPLHVTYGMTETASQVATSGRLAASPPAGFAGLPLPGVELDCGDPPGSRPLAIRGPMVMTGYANPRRLPGLGLADGWLATSDLARLGPDGGLTVLGRADEVLVSGGVNVHPGEVEERLLAAPGVAETVVVGLDDPVWGQRLAAVFTGSAEPGALDAWCRAHLDGARRPRVFLRLEALPALPSGKPDRRRLRELAAAASAQDPGASEPTNPLGRTTAART